MPERTRKQLNYTIACIHEFARKKKKTNQRDAYLYLRKFQGLSFLIGCYEAEHTLSIEEALDDMEMVCRKNGNTGD